MISTVSTRTKSFSKNKAANVALWILQIAAACMFFKAGSAKLSGDPMMVGLFQAVGQGQWLRYLTGTLEITGGVLLMIPPVAGIGGLLLSGVMAGAVLTHIFIIGGNPTMAVALLLASLIIAIGRGARTLSLASRYTRA